MLVISRKEGEAVFIGEAKITIIRIANKVQLGIEAPADIKIEREEIRDKETNVA